MMSEQDLDRILAEAFAAVFKKLGRTKP